jgi:hypothetical protein
MDNCHTTKQDWENSSVGKRTTVKFQVLTAASMMFRAVFWVVLQVDNQFTRQYKAEDSSEHLTLNNSVQNFTVMHYVSYVPGEVRRGEGLAGDGGLVDP